MTRALGKNPQKKNYMFTGEEPETQIHKTKITEHSQVTLKSSFHAGGTAQDLKFKSRGGLPWRFLVATGVHQAHQCWLSGHGGAHLYSHYLGGRGKQISEFEASLG